jgi:hypothetical protein
MLSREAGWWIEPPLTYASAAFGPERRLDSGSMIEGEVPMAGDGEPYGYRTGPRMAASYNIPD